MKKTVPSVGYVKHIIMDLHGHLFPMVIFPIQLTLNNNILRLDSRSLVLEATTPPTVPQQNLGILSVPKSFNGKCQIYILQYWPPTPLFSINSLSGNAANHLTHTKPSLSTSLLIAPYIWMLQLSFHLNFPAKMVHLCPLFRLLSSFQTNITIFTISIQ